MLSEAVVERYFAEGYVVVDDVLDAEEIDTLRALSDGFVSRAASLTRSDPLLDLDPAHTQSEPKVRRIKTPHLQHERFAALTRHPRILEVLRPLLGPDIRLHGSKLNLKSARHGAPVEWHQDWAFYPHTNDDLLAVGIPLDDCGPDNGPLLVLPGTHRGPTYDHHRNDRFVGAFDPAAAGLDVSKAVPLLARAGSITVHHVRLAHGSATNTSNRQRRLILYEYAAADAWPLRGVEHSFQEFRDLMVCGEDTLEPRVVPAPIRMPYPSAYADTIYELQEQFRAAEPAIAAQ